MPDTVQGDIGMLTSLLRWWRTTAGKSTVLLACVLFSAGAWMKTSGAFSPGDLSAVQIDGDVLEGYTSHAEFEQQCTHCHAPLHCIEDDRCQACHMDVAKQRSEMEGLHSRLPGTNNCRTCHPEHRGREAMMTEFAFLNIDHAALTGFGLDKHHLDYDDQTMNCESCHLQNIYPQTSLDCITCHTDEDPVYMETHRLDYGDGCLQCHDGRDRMADFDHNEIYELSGGHGDIECAECHPDHQYKDISTGCADCHEDPELHSGIFGTDCERCHSITGWENARLIEHVFLLEHGDQGRIDCVTCHEENYTTFTCYGCHDHQQEETESFHQNLEIPLEEIAACETCHPTGAAGEAERLAELHNVLQLP